MKRILRLVFLLFFIARLDFVYALDWKALHEKADQLNLSQARSALAGNPDSIDGLYILGLVYLNEHRDKKAEEAFQKIIALRPEVFAARWGLAEALRRQHKIEESEEILKALIKEYPVFAPAYITMAYLKYTQMDFEQTVALALKVIKRGRENVDLSNYTRAYLLVGGAKGMIASRGGPLSKVINGTAVLPNLKKAQALQPDSPAVLFGLGSFYFLAPRIAGGDIEQARDYLEKAVAIDPFFADAYVRLAQFYKVKDERQKSEEYLRKALEIDPQNALALDFSKGQCRFNCITVEE